MKPAQFEYLRPTSLAEACELLDRYAGEARPIAGGQSLVPMMNLRMVRPTVLVDLAYIPGLSGIRLQETSVSIGAMSRQSELLTDDIVRQHLPLVASGARHIGHFQTRSRGTIGGSLAHADPSAELPLVMVTLDAKFRLRSATGERLVAAREFFMDALTTVMSEREILTEIIVPAAPPGARVAFREFARRQGDFAIVSAAVQRSRSGDQLLAGLGAVGPVPHFCSKIGAALSGSVLDAARVLIDQEIEEIEPVSDLSATGEIRRRIAATLLDDCLREVFEQ